MYKGETIRVVVVGGEYTGVTALINGIYEWGKARGIDHHLSYLGISSIYLFAVSPVMTLV